MDPATLGFECGHHLQHQQRRGDAVLVPDGFRIAAVAQRLLVAEPQVRNLGDPLEPGQGGGVAEAGGTGDALQQRSGDDRLGVDTGGRCPTAAAPLSDPPAQQGTHLVAGEHPVILGGPDAGCTAVGVGIVGNDHVGALGTGVGQRQIHRSGFFGVGEVHRRESAVGGKLGRHFCRRGETRTGHCAHEHLTTHSVHGGVDRGDLTGTVAEQ